MSIIQTRSGVAFDILNPTADMVELDDIAWSLSNICRFNGHCSRFYSVAEHSYVGALHMAGAFGRNMQRAFLLHDAAEAYIGDICRPVKLALGPAVKEIEKAIQDAIHDRFDIGAIPSAHLGMIDDAMLVYEVRNVIRAPLVGEWPEMSDPPEIGVPLGVTPADAYQRFLGAAVMVGVE